MNLQDHNHPIRHKPLSPALRAVIESMAAQVATLNEEVVDRIVAEVPAYRESTDPALRPALVASTLFQGKLWYGTLLSATPPPAQAFEVMSTAARARVHQGVPLATLLHAFRIAGEVMWNQMLEAVRDQADLTSELLFNISLYHLYHFNLCSWTVSEAYSDEQLTVRTGELRRQKEMLEEEVKARTAQALAERTRAEEQTARLHVTRQELARSEYMASLGRVMAGVAHEVNTPVGNIRVSISSLQAMGQRLEAAFRSESLRRSELEAFFPAFSEATSLIARASQRAAELMSHLKDLSVDNRALVRRPFLVAPVVGQIVRALADELEARNVEVVLKIDPAIELFGDPARFEQILVTLISNALVHGFDGRAGGKIEIVAAMDDAGCRIRFADNGKGIAPEHLGKVFEPYYTTQFGKGRSGLGLYLVHNVVTAVFQGELSIDSQLGVGTEVTMNVPRSASMQAG